MITRPIYNTLLLPDVSYYFKKDFFSGQNPDDLEPGCEILFIQVKNRREDREYTAKDFYPSVFPLG